MSSMSSRISSERGKVQSQHLQDDRLTCRLKSKEVKVPQKIVMKSEELEVEFGQRQASWEREERVKTGRQN